MPASLYFLVMPNEWSCVMSRSESVPAKARNSTSAPDELMAPNHGLKSLVSSGAPATPTTSPPSFSTAVLNWRPSDCPIA
ncbi:MAG: hypothetical protein HW381_1630 [Candidatus Rokubacteria bacterium]|nr:hypothetical protein [Candidatus Rokubacteria bacterium]